MAGVGVVQVEDPPRRERRWGAGVAERCANNKRLMMGGSRTEEGPRKIQTRLRKWGGRGWIVLKNKRKSLRI